jgi:hypothetical protein
MLKWTLSITRLRKMRYYTHIICKVITIRSVPHSRCTTLFLTRATLVEQEPFTYVFVGFVLLNLAYVFCVVVCSSSSFCPISLWPLHCMPFFDLRLLITPLVSKYFWPLHCMPFFDLRLLITPLVSKHFWPLHCMPFFDLRLLITPLVYSTSSLKEKMQDKNHFHCIYSIC